MTNITRRSVLTGAVAAGVGAVSSVASSPARAAAPAAGKQAAGIYRYKVGTHEMTVITDGVNRFPLPDNIVSNVKPDDVKAALAASYMDPNVFFNPYNPVVVNTGSKLVLIDTGTGEAAYNASGGQWGQFLTNLLAAGIDPKSIDTVIISHYHGDHVNGLLRADNSLTFPNAEILVPAEEHKFWMDDGEMSRAPKGRMEELFANNRRVFRGDVLKHLRTYQWGEEVAPGITAIATPGHSWAHTSHVVSSGSSSVFVQADVTHVPFLFVRNPGWHAFYDQDGPKAEATRRRVYDMLAADKMLVQGFHYPFPGLAHIDKDGAGYRAVPIAWNPAI